MKICHFCRRKVSTGIFHSLFLPAAALGHVHTVMGAPEWHYIPARVVGGPDSTGKTKKNHKQIGEVRQKILIVVEMFWIFSKFWSLNFGFPRFFLGPGGFRKVREVCRKNFPQFSSESDFLVTSYDQKTEKVHDY